MGSLVSNTVVVFVNRPLTIRETDWSAQLIEKASNEFRQWGSPGRLTQLFVQKCKYTLTHSNQYITNLCEIN